MGRIIRYQDLKPGDKFDFNGNHAIVLETGAAVVVDGPWAGQELSFPAETPIDIFKDDAPGYRYHAGDARQKLAGTLEERLYLLHRIGHEQGWRDIPADLSYRVATAYPDRGTARVGLVRTDRVVLMLPVPHRQTTITATLLRILLKGQCRQQRALGDWYIRGYQACFQTLVKLRPMIFDFLAAENHVPQGEGPGVATGVVPCRPEASPPSGSGLVVEELNDGTIRAENSTAFADGSERELESHPNPPRLVSSSSLNDCGSTTGGYVQEIEAAGREHANSVPTEPATTSPGDANGELSSS